MSELTELELPCAVRRRDHMLAGQCHGGLRVALTCHEDPHEACVNLDRASVEKLHAWLGAWLERDDG